jgi:beta-lactamase regulating signal transducer with metallopeptidase domain
MKKARYLIALLALLVAFSMVSACSTSRSTTTTTTTKKADQSAPQESTTTTVTTDEPDSVLGATVHAIGTIVLFPFRLVGDAIGLLV